MGGAPLTRFVGDGGQVVLADGVHGLDVFGRPTADQDVVDEFAAASLSAGEPFSWRDQRWKVGQPPRVPCVWSCGAGVPSRDPGGPVPSEMASSGSPQPHWNAMAQIDLPMCRG